MIRTDKHGFRDDIQALRGIAVLLVLLYHSGLGLAVSGYLGVDIFFVVSGFLITRIVFDTLDRGSFSFAGFYTRRARRLLPASYVVLLLTTLSGAASLGLSVYERFWNQLLGSVLFVANFVLWRQINYFHPSATYELLLHMWSLAVEEQYYLVLPIVLWLTPRSRRNILILTVSAVSLAAYCLLAARSPGATFYLLPTRAWELGLGSLGTLAINNPAVRRWARLLFWPACLTVAAVPMFPLPTADFNPGLLAVCLATLLVILARHEAAPGKSPVRLLARVGDISYSLYLVHWPIFAIAHNAFLTEQIPAAVAFAGIGLSIGVAYLLFLWVEEPVRRSTLSGGRLIGAALAGAALVLGVGAGALHIKRKWSASSVDLAGVAGLPGCESYRGGPFEGACSQGPNPQIFVWGDSFSQHLIPGLMATTRRRIAEASKGHCAPFANLAPMQGPGERAFALSCLEFNSNVLANLARMKSVEVVVLSGFYYRNLDPTFTMLRRWNGALVTVPATAATALAAQEETTAALRKMGKRVVIVSGPPMADYDVGMCWERRAAGLPSFGSRASCEITSRSADRLFAPTLRLMDSFAHITRTPVIRLDQVLCRTGTCVTALGGVPLYRDNYHLGWKGSEQIGHLTNLGERVWREAR